MLERILIAGSGGQGIILIGRTLAAAAVRHFTHVTFFPAYGAEVRGGTSNCQVVLSASEISSPVCEHFDSMVIMNPKSAEKFLPMATGQALVLLNGFDFEHDRVPHPIVVDATGMANDLGDTRVANFIMLGALLSHKTILPSAEIEDRIRETFSGKGKELVELNLRAFRLGMKQKAPGGIAPSKPGG